MSLERPKAKLLGERNAGTAGLRIQGVHSRHGLANLQGGESASGRQRQHHAANSGLQQVRMTCALTGPSMPAASADPLPTSESLGCGHDPGEVVERQPGA